MKNRTFLKFLMRDLVKADLDTLIKYLGSDSLYTLIVKTDTYVICTSIISNTTNRSIEVYKYRENSKDKYCLKLNFNLSGSKAHVYHLTEEQYDYIISSINLDIHMNFSNSFNLFRKK